MSLHTGNRRAILFYFPFLFLSFFHSSSVFSAQLIINITGLPGDDASVLISGAGSNKVIQASDTLYNLPAATYTIRTQMRQYPGIPAPRVYRTEKLTYMVSLRADEVKTIELHFSLLPASGKLWFGNQNSDRGERIIAFANTSLRNSGQQQPVVRLTGALTSPRGMTFDLLGNLWVVDGASGVKRFPWHKLNQEDVASDRHIPLESPFSLAFDASGNLWISQHRQIIRIPSQSIYGDDPELKPDVILTSRSFHGLRGIAFDREGKLWVASSENNQICMVATDQLENSAELTIRRCITAQSSGPVISTLSAPYSLAFDEQGGLWVGYFGPNMIARVRGGHLQTGGTITPKVQISLSVGILIDHMTFDTEGNLWLPTAAGEFGMLTPTQLKSAGRKEPAVIIDSPTLRYGTGIALFTLPE